MEGFSTALTGAVTTMLGLVSTVFTAIIDNPVLLLFLATSVIGSAIALFRGLRQSV